MVAPLVGHLPCSSGARDGTSTSTRPDHSGGAKSGGPNQRRARAISWLTLLAMFGVMWLWRSQSESRGHPNIDYSTLYSWAERGQLESATLKGRRLDGQLRSAAKVEGRDVTEFHTELPERDDSLLPLLRAKGTRITVEREEQPFAIQLVLSILPW